MLNSNIYNFLGCDSSYEAADIVLFGAPFDSTTSYRPGTRFGCSEIRNQSFGIETYSPYLDKDIEDINVFDSGDIELCFGNTEKALRQIEERVSVIANDKKVPFMMGGEHLVTLGAVRALSKIYRDINIIHFDAHTDLREDYLGEKLSHACVIRRCYELINDGKIYQFGIRSGLKEEFVWAESHTHLNKFDFDGLEKAVEALKDKPVYFTLDLDVLDPSVFPGTGTPEHGGVSFNELMHAVYTVGKCNNVIGCDVCELSPHYDISGSSTAAACKAVREIMLSIKTN